MGRKKLHLLHGWGFDAKVMEPLARALEQDFTVERSDVPGYTTTARGCRGLTAIVDNLVNRVDEETIMVGWSLGGNVAIQFASLKHATQPLVLVCCNPGFVRRRGWPTAISPAAINDLQGRLQRDPESALQSFVGWCAMGDRSIKRTRRILQDYAVSACVDTGSLSAGLKVLSDLDQRITLARLKCPVLMLFAGRDRLIPVAAAEGCRALADHLNVKVIEGCGHALPVSSASRTAEEIRAFCAEN